MFGLCLLNDSDWKWKLRMRDFLAFAQVFLGPDRAKVLPVAADLHLIRLCEIECRAWHDVVNVPAALVLPCHAFNKLTLYVVAQLLWSASGHLVSTDGC